MNEQKQTIIFDSSGLTALMNETDEFHTRALSMSEILTDRALWQVILPNLATKYLTRACTELGRTSR